MWVHDATYWVGAPGVTRDKGAERAPPASRTHPSPRLPWTCPFFSHPANILIYFFN